MNLHSCDGDMNSWRGWMFLQTVCQLQFSKFWPIWKITNTAVISLILFQDGRLFVLCFIWGLCCLHISLTFISLQVLLLLQAKTEEEHAKAQMIICRRPETLRVWIIWLWFPTSRGPVWNKRGTQMTDLSSFMEGPLKNGVPSCTRHLSVHGSLFYPSCKMCGNNVTIQSSQWQTILWFLWELCPLSKIPNIWAFVFFSRQFGEVSAHVLWHSRFCYLAF